jgi:hypothetical protein
MRSTCSGHRFAWGVAVCLLALGGSVPAQAGAPQFTPVAQAAPGVLQMAPSQPKGALSEQARQRLADQAVRPAPVSGRVANEAAPALSTARQVSPNHLEPLWGQDAVPAQKGDAVAKPQTPKVAAPLAPLAPRGAQRPNTPDAPQSPAAQVIGKASKSAKSATQPQSSGSAAPGAEGNSHLAASGESHADAAKPKRSAHASKHALARDKASRRAKPAEVQPARRRLGAHAEPQGHAHQSGKISPKPAGKTPGVAAATRAKPAGKPGVFHVKHGARATAAKATAAKSKSAKPTAAKISAVKPAGKGHASPAKASGKTKLAKGSKGTKASAAKGAKSAQGKHPATRHRG